MRRYLLVTFAIAALLCFVAALNRIANVRAEGASATSASRPIAKRFPEKLCRPGASTHRRLRLATQLE